MRFKQLLSEYESLSAINNRAKTVKSKRRILIRFFRYLAGKGTPDFNKVTVAVMLAYLDFLKVSEKYSHNYIYLQFSVLRGFFRFLYRQRYICHDSISSYPFLKRKQELVKNLPSQEEIEKLLSEELELLDRTLLELFYGTGLRLSEGISLNVADLDFNSNLIFVHKGKGAKDRIVPATDHLMNLLKDYLKQRAETQSEDEPLFLSHTKKRLTPSVVYRVFKKLKSKMNKNITPHTLRHCFATHLLQNGARIRDIQEILGHESLSSTERYTHLEISDLKRVLKRFHPRENEIYSDESVTTPQGPLFKHKKGCRRHRK